MLVGRFKPIGHRFRINPRVQKMSSKRKQQARSNSINDDPMLKHPSPKRAKEIDADPPFAQLEELLQEQKTDHKTHNVLHWFRSKDLRQDDNKALWAASQQAKKGDGRLISMYLHSPKDLEWHGTSPARIDFVLETLKLLRAQLAEKNIPLAILVAQERKQKKETVMDFIKKHGVSHVFANFEYEVDELRRDIGVARAMQESGDVSIQLYHDQTVMTPGRIVGGGGKPMKVFTPYHKSWLVETKKDPTWFDSVPAPEANDKKAVPEFGELFQTEVPEMPGNKQFESREERDRLRRLWPAGHDAGMDRLDEFLNKKVSAGFLLENSEMATNYCRYRNTWLIVPNPQRI